MSAARVLPIIGVPSSDDIPKSLFELDQWVLADRGKVPRTVTGARADITRPQDYASCEAAIRALQTNREEYWCLGFALTDNDGIVGFDGDHFFDERGNIKPRAQWVIDLFIAAGLYIEVSPNGHGVRAFGYAKLPKALRLSLGDGCKVEAWAGTGRYLTVTCNAYLDAPRELEQCQFVVDRLLEFAAASQPARDGNVHNSGDTRAPEEVSNIKRYVTAALDAECGRIESALPGFQNETLNRAAHALGRLVSYIELSTVKDRFLTAGGRMSNQPGRPPWTQAKLLRVIESGFAAGVRNPRQLVEGAAKPSLQLIEQRAPNPPTKSSKVRIPEVVSAEELLAKDLAEPLPIVDSLLYPGVTLLVGRPKVGKSWLALQVGLAMVGGSALAGHFRVRLPGRVLYLALEESQTRTVSRIRKLAPAPPDGIQDLRFVYSIDSLQAGGAAQIDELLATYPTEVLIVDTLLAVSRAMNRSNDIVRGDYAEISVFSEIAKKRNCAILLVHHSRKDSSQHDDVDAIIGTSGTSAAVDAIWHLKRGKTNESILLSTVGREIEREQYEFRFDLDKGGLLFTASGEDVNRSEQQNAIVELLENEDRPLSPERIASILQKNRVTVRRLLQKLYQDDVIRKSLDGKYFVGIAGGKSHVQ